MSAFVVAKKQLANGCSSLCGPSAAMEPHMEVDSIRATIYAGGHCQEDQEITLPVTKDKVLGLLAPEIPPWCTVVGLEPVVVPNTLAVITFYST